MPITTFIVAEGPDSCGDAMLNAMKVIYLNQNVLQRRLGYRRNKRRQLWIVLWIVAVAVRSPFYSRWWCSCRHCPPQHTKVESLCGQDWDHGQFLLREAEEMEVGATLSCLNQHSGFYSHLDKGVLEKFFFSHLERINWRKPRRSQGSAGQISNRQVSQSYFCWLPSWSDG